MNPKHLLTSAGNVSDASHHSGNGSRKRKRRVRNRIVLLGVGLLVSVSQQALSSQAGKSSTTSRTPVATTTLPACGEEAFSTSGAGALTVEVGSGAEPGATDPMGIPAGRYQLFPDDGLLAYRADNARITATYYTTDSDTSLGLDRSQDLQTLAWDPDGSGPPPIFATGGRILHSDKDSVVTATRVGNEAKNGTVAINFLDEGASTVLQGLLPRQPGSTDFIAVGHGDLDNILGADGNLHDEVVVARVSGESTSDKHYFGYRLAVLNYGNGHVSHPDISEVQFAEVAPDFNHDSNKPTGMLPSDNILSIAVGDFEGDGKKEIAIVALGDTTLLLYTYRYDTVNGKHAVTLIRSQKFGMQGGGSLPGYLGTLPLVGTIAAVASDLDGNGADEIAIAYAKWGRVQGSNEYDNYGVGVMVLKYDVNFQATPQSTDRLFAAGAPFPRLFQFQPTTRPRVELVSGQFLFDPPRIPYGRRQLVLGWHNLASVVGGLSTINLLPLSASTDLKTLSNIGPVGSFEVRNLSTINQFSLAAGGFEGASGKLPVASLGLGYWAGNPQSVNGPTSFVIQTLRVTESGGVSKARERQYAVNLPVDLRGRFPLIAYDRPGNSRYLGAPIHMTMMNAPTTEYIMQEPPKHAYWDEGKHQVLNLTRFDHNNVHLYNGTTASMSTESKDQSARATGGSLSASAGATVTAGGDFGSFGIFELSTEASIDVQARASYDYNQHKEGYDSGYSSRTIESTGQTDRDDFIKGKLQTTDIWRYRMYGTRTGGPQNAFYEVILPGRVEPFQAGGLSLSWYQPVHENGNILSYPARLGASSDPYIPRDIGSYQLQNGTTKTGSPQVPAQLNYFDGTGASTALRFATEVGQGKSFTYNHEIAESLDVKASYTATAKSPFGGLALRVCGSIEAHNSNSWGGAETSTETTRNETAVTLNRAAGRSNVAYPFYPVVYNTVDGTMKMAFAVPNPADPLLNQSGYQTYADLYGGLPDPALNLPHRLVPQAAGTGELEQWAPNEKIGRKAMRGLFFRKPEIDPAAKTYLLLGFNPQDGETVRIEPRIYNHSTAQRAVGTVVEFQVIPYDSSTNSEVCDNPINQAIGVNTGLVCPRSGRTTIGRTVVPQLNPRQFTCADGYDDPASTGCAPPVFLNWNTKGFGPPLGTNEYRVYIVLNPDEPVGSEKYGIEPNPISVTNISNTSPMVVTAPRNTLNTGDRVIVGGVQGLDAANGTFRITRVNDHEFSLDGSVNSRGSYTGGGTVALLDPGQNNEGYSILGVTRMLAIASAQGEDRIPHDYLEGDALEALSEQGTPQLVNSQLATTQNTPLDLRFTAHSSLIHTDAAHMLLYDGDPASGAPAISDQIIHPGANGPAGASIWFEWTPTTTGVHHLYAVLLEGTGTQKAMTQLDVDVAATP